MASRQTTPTGREVRFAEHEIIVSKTDLKGRITYCNDVFCRVAGYQERELLGQPHSIIRHPDMPRAAFKLVWDTIERGEEIFAYVINMAKSGAHYWVFAHVTPSFDAAGRIVGYHSSRRLPRPEAIAQVEPLYRRLLDIERQSPDRKQGMLAAHQALVEQLRAGAIGYDEFVLAL